MQAANPKIQIGLRAISDNFTLVRTVQARVCRTDCTCSDTYILTLPPKYLAWLAEVHSQDLDTIAPLCTP